MNKDQLLNFIDQTTPDKLQVEEELGHGFVRLNITEAHKRQAKDDIRCVEDAIVELLRNSRDAGAKKIYVASWKQEKLRNIVIIDDGDGIPSSLIDKIFEPRVTSKLNKINYDTYGLHGRGMALYSITLNCLEAKVTFSKPKAGTAIKIIFDTSQVSEKANQSTWPAFTSKGTIKEGPYNIIRHCLEFNISHPDLEVYLGTPAEILNIINDATDAKALYAKACELGLDVSLRNCQRVIYGEIKDLKPMLKAADYNPKLSSRSLRKSDATTYLQPSDLEDILIQVQKIVNDKGREYFLKVAEDANIIKVGNKLKIILPLEIDE